LGGVGFGLAAAGAAVGKAGLVGLELELFRADDAGFDGESHSQRIGDKRIEEQSETTTLLRW
jgi:hypothetical protein